LAGKISSAFFSDSIAFLCETLHLVVEILHRSQRAIFIVNQSFWDWELVKKQLVYNLIKRLKILVSEHVMW
jgi:hypothetical protein